MKKSHGQRMSYKERKLSRQEERKPKENFFQRNKEKVKTIVINKTIYAVLLLWEFKVMR